jgi:hypothetical protein
MTSRHTSLGVATGYLRVGQQRNRGFISDKSTSTLDATQPPVQRVLESFLHAKAAGLETTL